MVVGVVSRLLAVFKPGVIGVASKVSKLGVVGVVSNCCLLYLSCVSYFIPLQMILS